jgi:uncharacterized protein (DUF433 family)
MAKQAPLFESHTVNQKGEFVTKPRVVDRGDGPKIEGTRITVYTVLDYLRADRTIPARTGLSTT